ncbi:MAG TPA: hypothetical protein VGR57_11535 [Ktedonobacterales bacterium]|nr:hypothetical protein [Ktedonobacterales bacterium]
MVNPVNADRLGSTDEREQPAPASVAESEPSTPSGPRSRRALLKLGGAAAAAGVAAVAAGATELARPETAHASGILWLTGVINADVQTYVQPLNSFGGFSDPTLLAVQVGLGSVNAKLSGHNQAAIAAYDATGSGSSMGVYATSSGGIGVQGISASGDAVRGQTTNGSGVYGSSTTGIGVYGTSTDQNGVRAISTNLDGIYTVGGRYGASVQGSLAQLHFQGLPGTPGAPTAGTHDRGELYVDGSVTLWVCVAGGTPGTWVRLSGVANGVPGGALNYLPTPIRIYDTRGGTSAPLPVSKGALAGQSTTTIQVTGTSVATDQGMLSVPVGATGVFGNLTVTNTQGGGDLILWPHGAQRPNTSNINYGPGQTVANSVNVGLSSDGKMDLFVHVSTTDVIFDVAGYVI